MAESDSGAAAASRAAEKAEAASAGMVIQALAKADRGFGMYLPNNPLHAKFFDDFRQRVEEHLGKHGDLTLELTHQSLVCSGETVYTSDGLRENIAFRLYADGIRSLTLVEGIEPRELRTLVEILGRSSQEADEDDVATRLWSAELAHVNYVLADLPSAGGEGARAVAPAPARGPGRRDPALRRRARRRAAAPRPAAARPRSRSSRSTRRNWPRCARSSSPRRSARRSTTWRASSRPSSPRRRSRSPRGVPRDHRAALRRPAAHRPPRRGGGPARGPHRRRGRPRPAAGARGADRGRPRPGGHARRARGVHRASSRRRRRRRPRAAAPAVAALGRHAIEPFCRVLGDVPGKETRKVLIEALADTGRGTPELFLPFLADARWYLVRNTIYILRRIGGAESARAVLRCSHHRDPRVRKEVLLYFEETGDPAGESVPLAYLSDETAQLRMSAARDLARRGSRAAAERAARRHRFARVRRARAGGARDLLGGVRRACAVRGAPAPAGAAAQAAPLRQGEGAGRHRVRVRRPAAHRHPGGRRPPARGGGRQTRRGEGACRACAARPGAGQGCRRCARRRRRAPEADRG